MARKLLTIITLAAALCAGAQTSQIATLLHDGQLTNFYSGSALIQAYEAAVDGDVITLSSGMFNATDIKKNITIRGAGMGLVEAGDKTLPTRISGNFEIDCPVSDTQHLTLEGIQSQNNDRIGIYTANNLIIEKCDIQTLELYYRVQETRHNIAILQSNIGTCQNRYNGINGTLTAINCIFNRPAYSSTSFDCNYSNCLIGTNDASFYVNYSSLSNCIINGFSTNSTSISSNCSVNNCILSKCDYNYSNDSNKFVESPEEIFTEEGYYRLTDEAKAFLGTDGKEVGIYGGTLPFDTTPSNPQITKFNVSPKTTADGKLSVDIEVHGVE
ncbi:MAG: hypothetical protein K1V84_11330 [Muribaculaceae bacterium]